MALAHQLFERFDALVLGRARLVQRFLVGGSHQVVHDAPCAVHELVDARQAALVPQQVLVGRGHEQDVGAHGVGAVLGDHVLGGDDVALRLRHRLAVLVLHHALAQQVRERLVELKQPQVAQHFRVEAAVQQVQDGMLDAADVLVDGHPTVRLLGRERQLLVVRIGVAQVVPAGACERVHRVRLALRRAAAYRARRVHERLVRGKRLACSQVDVLGQAHRKVLLRHGHEAAFRAVHGRDGVAPVALTADQPIAQAELHGLLALALGREVADDRIDGGRMLAAHHAGVLAGLHQHAFGIVGRFPIDRRHAALLHAVELGIQRIVLAEDDGDDGQVVLARELEVALVAARHGHDRAGAVVADDVVGHPYGHLLPVHRVHHIATGERAVLLAVALGALDGAHLGGAFHHLAHGGFVLGALHQLHEALVLGRQQEERAAEQGIGTRGEHGDHIVGRRFGRSLAVGPAQHEVDFGAFGAADPVRLHLLDALGPTVQLVEVVQQLLGVVGDLEVPLREVALLHRAVATPALALGDLLVREHRRAVRAPVHRAVAALDQTALPELQEDPLAPAVVLGVARHHGAVPVVREAHALEAGLLRVDVGVGPFGRMAVALDGRVLGRQAERVPTHGMQHVEAAHLVVARDDVADGVVAHVSHVDVARGVREHLEHVLLRLRGILGHLVQVGIVPLLLPAGFDLVRVVRFHGHWFSSSGRRPPMRVRTGGPIVRECSYYSDIVRCAKWRLSHPPENRRDSKARCTPACATRQDLVVHGGPHSSGDSRELLAKLCAQRSHQFESKPFV